MNSEFDNERKLLRAAVQVFIYDQLIWISRMIYNSFNDATLLMWSLYQRCWSRSNYYVQSSLIDVSSNGTEVRCCSIHLCFTLILWDAFMDASVMHWLLITDLKHYMWHRLWYLGSNQFLQFNPAAGLGWGVWNLLKKASRIIQNVVRMELEIGRVFQTDFNKRCSNRSLWRRMRLFSQSSEALAVLFSSRTRPFFPDHPSTHPAEKAPQYQESINKNKSHPGMEAKVKLTTTFLRGPMTIKRPSTRSHMSDFKDGWV